MKYDLVVFDFDGTIADTSAGILDSHRYTLKKMGLKVPCETKLLSFIGGNLLNIYVENVGLTEQEARVAVNIYRNRYAEIGVHNAVLYPKFTEMLKLLRNAGYMIGVATLKAEKFAKIMLKDMGIDAYFNHVCGMDENDRLDKAGLILKCSALCGIDKERTVLIGDSQNDFIGSQKAKVDFIGVTYGFGFKKGIMYDFQHVDSVDELIRVLLP